MDRHHGARVLRWRRWRWAHDGGTRSCQALWSRPLPLNTTDIVGLLIASLGGAAVGLERQWSGDAEGPAARFAGIRTFAMLGAIGGLTGLLWTVDMAAPATILFAGAVTIVVAAYAHAVGRTSMAQRKWRRSLCW